MLQETALESERLLEDGLEVAGGTLQVSSGPRAAGGRGRSLCDRLVPRSVDLCRTVQGQDTVVGREDFLEGIPDQSLQLREVRAGLCSSRRALEQILLHIARKLGDEKLGGTLTGVDEDRSADRVQSPHTPDQELVGGGHSTLRCRDALRERCGLQLSTPLHMNHEDCGESLDPLEDPGMDRLNRAETGEAAQDAMVRSIQDQHPTSLFREGPHGLVDPLRLLVMKRW